MKQSYYLFFLLLFLISFPLFHNLGQDSIRLWDESRLANASYEMLKNKHYIIRFFNGRPDFISTKPPMVVWMQVLSMKILGPNELAIRLPSALAAFLLCIAIFIFSIKVLRSPIVGFLAPLILVTSSGYIGLHLARTGDHDSLLVMFSVLYALMYYLFLKSGKPKYLYLTSVFITFAVLTKGVAGLFLLPGLLIYTLIRKKFIPLVRSKHFYFSIIIFAVFAIGYYVVHEIITPGYLKAVFQNELGGRYFEINSGHKGPVFFYFKNLVTGRFTPWYWLTLLSIVLIFSKKLISNRIRDYLIYNLIIIFSFLLVISLSKSKGMHYDGPVIPLLAISAALPLCCLINQIYKTIDGNIIKSILSILIIISIFYKPYKSIMQKVHKGDIYGNAKTHYGDFIKKNSNKNYKIFVDGYNAPLYFYLKVYNDKGYQLELIRDINEIGIGQEVLLCEEKKIKQLKKYFDVKMLKSNNECIFVKIVSSVYN